MSVMRDNFPPNALLKLLFNNFHPQQHTPFLQLLQLLNPLQHSSPQLYKQNNINDSNVYN